MHLGLVAIEDQKGLVEVGLRVGVHLLAAQHRPGLGAPTRVANQRGAVADDEDDRGPVVLKGAKRIEHDEVTNVQVRRRRVEPELDPELVSTLQSSIEVLGDMDFNRPLLQALEELPAHLLVDWVAAEIDLWIGRQRRLEQGDDRTLDRSHTWSDDS